MAKRTILISTFIAAAILAAPTWVGAAPPSAACSVEVNHVVNGTVIETYTKDFVVTRGVAFVDDCSTSGFNKKSIYGDPHKGSRKTGRVDRLFQ